MILFEVTLKQCNLISSLSDHCIFPLMRCTSSAALLVATGVPPYCLPLAVSQCFMGQTVKGTMTLQLPYYFSTVAADGLGTSPDLPIFFEDLVP